MVAAMTPQGNHLMAHLQNRDSETFYTDLVPLLDQFTASITGISSLFPLSDLQDENVQQAIPLIQPLLELLSADGPVPYPQVIMALSTILTPLPYEELQNLGLTPMIKEGLQSQLPDLQILALQQVRKMSIVDDPTVQSLIDILGAEDATVGKEAVDVMTSVSAFQVSLLT